MSRPRARPGAGELQRLIHELRVQQVELERQNEEIRAAQRELEAERDRVADLYQLAPVAHLILDRRGAVVEATVLAVALLGVDRRRLARRRLHELVAPADWPILSRHLADVFASTARQTCDLGLLTDREAVRAVRLSSVAVADAGGPSTRCRTALMDITERQQTEVELKDSRAQFESIVTSALDAIVTVGEDGCVILMNPAAEQMLGCKASVAVGHAFDRFVQESSREWYQAVIMASAEKDASGSTHGRLGAMVARRADGTEFPVEASISEVAGRWGRLFTVILRDVSARQQAEHALAERLRLEQLVAHLTMAFGHSAAVGFDAEIQRGLRAVADFLGVDRGGLVEFSRGGGVARCWAVESWMGVGDFPWMAARLQHGESVTVSRVEDIPEEAPTDRRSYLAYRIKPQVAVPLETAGTVVGALVFSTIGAERAASPELTRQLHILGEVFANLLARKQVELELHALRKDLGHVTRVSTIGELTTSLAHELSQPLTAILSNAQAAELLLESKTVNLEKVRDALAGIVEADLRAGEVIRGLRGLLKNEAPEVARHDVNEMVREVARLVGGDAGLRDVSLRLDLSPELPRARCDRVQVQQVILNLVLNGLDAMPESFVGDRALVLSTAREGSGAIRIAVRDTGLGIGAADVDHIFQAFYTTKDDGLGMGLAIARSIVEAHGGRVEARNNPDRGATISFTLPVSEDGS